MSTVFSLEQVEKILSNFGIDVTCGECMSIGFTGSGSGAVHTCKVVDSGVTFHDSVKQHLQSVPGIIGTFVGETDIVAIAKELGDVDWEALVEAEHQLSRLRENVNITIRASQNRNIIDFCGMKRLF